MNNKQVETECDIYCNDCGITLVTEEERDDGLCAQCEANTEIVQLYFDQFDEPITLRVDASQTKLLREYLKKGYDCKTLFPNYTEED